MYDFLSSKLLPKVYTDTPSLDNYEASNLISDQYSSKIRGFLAYSTVKPPIEITFELISSVNIHYINLTTSIGTQKCTAIELLAKKFNESFISIGYAKFDSNGVVFCNPRFYSRNTSPPNFDKSHSLYFLRSGSYKSFTAANFVKVRILQTQRSVPCLGKVEIWGKPSKTCSLTTLNSLNHLMQANNPQCISEPSKPVSVSDDWKIPEEFKDMLTFEVMSVPLTLPSGKTVDKTTLQRYLANEVIYGRPASDPFTGLAFTNDRKPLINTALKSRIDMFLLQHSENPETFSIQRTLGKRPSTSEVVKEFSSTKKLRVSEPCNIESIEIKDADELLDDAIKRTMKSSDFIQFTALQEAPTPLISSCSKCKDTSNLYRAACDHLYCKNCLLNLCKQVTCCCVCDKRFSRSDVTKFYR